MNRNLLNDIIQWDVKTWSKALAFWEENVNWDKAENCLELGAREGGLSLWLSQKGKSVVCSDLSNTRAAAEKLHLKYEVTGNIKYIDIDATDIPYSDYFDIIVFKSMLGGIVCEKEKENQVQRQALHEIYKALKPGGKLLFAENSVASPFHAFLRRRFSPWQNYWNYVSMNRMQTMLKPFSFSQLKSTGFLAALGRNEKQREFLAIADDLLFNKICPGSWKYVIYGVAEK